MWVSIDYGITNPFAALLWTVRGGAVVAFDEYSFDSREKGYRKTDAMLYRELKAKISRYDIESIVVDPSASSFIEEIRADGLFTVIPADNEVVPGIQNVDNLIQLDRLKVCERCREAVDEFGQYVWDSKSAETKVIKEHDHAMDAIRYFVRTIYRKQLAGTV